jgi:protein-tyrosine-phosphatase
MRIHYICLGNAYRSPMAEAYTKFYLEHQGIDGVEVLSSGTIARERHEYTRPVAASTLKFLGSKGLAAYAKSGSDQLTPELIQPSDITICMNSKVCEGLHQIAQLPEGTTYTWDVTDSDEGEQPAPVPGDERWIKHTEHIYRQITELVHELVHQQIV